MKYTPTIGIECHVQLKTATKLFAAIGNDARAAAPNSLISHICVGMPGALPVLNKAAIELSARAAFALNTKPQKFSKFDRKHYFYPDLPKGYQITQYEAPIIADGYLEFTLDGQLKRINIERANLEEDAGKTIHPPSADFSLVDLNRAGTPLLEIVCRPELHSPAEAKAYARELWLTMKYADITEGDLYHGHVRFDVNISLSGEPDKLGTRAEIKNLNSFRSVEGAIEYEIKRQSELLNRGGTVIQETRGWDEAKQRTTAQRHKEEAHDYRYMPEPDIPPLELDESFIKDQKSQMPSLPPEIRAKLSGARIDTKTAEDIIDNPAVCAKTMAAIDRSGELEVVRRVAFDSLEQPETLDIGLTEHLKVAEMLRSKQISSTAAKEILLAKAADPTRDIDELAAARAQVSDEAQIDKIVAQVLAQNAKAANDIKNGELKAIGFLVGQVMAKSQGKANPGLAQQLIRKQLGV